jgi:YidC/Oxa1 family membrane protein insertase
LLGLVIYYMAQAILRIAQQAYITRAFYGHDEALGRQAQRAGERARELAKTDGSGGGLLQQAKRDLASARGDTPRGNAAVVDAKSTAPVPKAGSKRTTEPKGRPTPTGKGPAGRPQRSSTSARPGGPRTNGGKRRR